MKASLVIMILILEWLVVDCFLVCTESIRRRGPIIYAAKDASDGAEAVAIETEITATKIVVETTKIPSKKSNREGNNTCYY